MGEFSVLAQLYIVIYSDSQCALQSILSRSPVGAASDLCLVYGIQELLWMLGKIKGYLSSMGPWTCGHRW